MEMKKDFLPNLKSYHSKKFKVGRNAKDSQCYEALYKEKAEKKLVSSLREKVFTTFWQVMREKNGSSV
jgi:hypothetical protein